MNVLDIYKIVDKEKINIESYNWNNAKARIFEIDSNYYIGIDKNKIYNSIEEKEILAEELGHYYCDALYYVDTDRIIKSKCEYRAKKWAYSVLVPIHKLKQKIAQGLNLYELSDFFEVDSNYMYDCINFYIEKYGVLI